MILKTNRTFLVLLFGLIVTLITPISSAQTTQPNNTRDNDIAAISQAALNALNTQQTRGAFPVEAGGETITTDIQIEGGWSLGFILTRAADIEGEDTGPDLRLFIAKSSETRDGVWNAAVEYNSEFYEWLEQIPDGTFIPAGAKETLLASNPTGAVASRGNGAAELALPFATGETWYLSGGPHGNNGNGVRPWSALDLSIRNSSGGMGIGRIRAAREGYVYRTSSCPNFIRIDHAGGWQTGYYHVNEEQVINGEYVARGTFLGYTSSRVGCGGWSSGPHVHFTIRYYGTHQEMDNTDIGGYNFQEGTSAYRGCFTRLYDGYEGCVGDDLYNAGIIGTNLLEGTGGEFINDTRYDFNGDRVPDLWAVNARNGITDSVSLHIVSGSSPTTTLLSTATGMPRQPTELNTAFASGDYNRDGVPDLWVIHRWDGSQQTAFRIMDGTNPNQLIGDVITGLPIFDDNVSFLVEHFDNDRVLDLWAVIPDEKDGKIRVRIADGDNPVFVLRDALTPIQNPDIHDSVYFAASDWNLDGHRDLWVIYANDKATNSLRVKIISGENFNTVLFDGRTLLGQQTTDADELGFTATDFNRDGTPDLVMTRRDINYVQVINGKDFQSFLANTSVALPATNSSEWQVLGGDRSRVIPLPETPILIKPEINSVVNKPQQNIKWSISGQTAKYRLKIKNANGLVVKYAFKDLPKHCSKNTCIVNLRFLNIRLADNTEYTWWISAINSTGVVNSVFTKFTTDIPGKPIITSPSETSFTSGEPLTFTWEGTSVTKKYVVMVYNEDRSISERAVIFASSCTDNQCSHTFDTTFPPGTYKWKVKAVFKDAGQKYISKTAVNITMNPASVTRANNSVRNLPDILETNGRFPIPPPEPTNG